jgi:hypothetical protein
MARASRELTNATVARLLRHVDEIHADLSELVHSAWMYRQILDVVARNAAIDKPSPIHRWYVRNYGVSACASVRRMVDRRKGTASLRRLLDEVDRYRTSITRDWHKQLYFPEIPPEEVGRWIRMPGLAEIADQTFTNLTGSREARFFPASVVRADIAALERDCDKVEKFTTKKIAHLALSEEGIVPPKFDEIDVAVATLERIFLKYLCLLTASQPMTLLPTYIWDWKKVLRVAWINPSEEPDG